VETVKDYIMAATKRTKAQSPSHDGDSDALALLTSDHEEVKQLFESYEALVEDDEGEDEKQALAQEICSMLTIHATIEEEIFYPAAREGLDDQSLLDEAEVEHASAKDLIAQIEDMQPDDALFDAKMKVLGEYVAHHVTEEEEELFPEVRSAGLDLAALGKELSDRKDQLLAQLGVEEDA
jgi:hypothetical protein